MTGTCKNQYCIYPEQQTDTICPVCGYCEDCHNASWKGSCGNKISLVKNNKFTYLDNENLLHSVGETYKCRECGSEEWVVGTGDYVTAIKCTNCEYEVVIHRG